MDFSKMVDNTLELSQILKKAVYIWELSVYDIQGIQNGRLVRSLTFLSGPENNKNLWRLELCKRDNPPDQFVSVCLESSTIFKETDAFNCKILTSYKSAIWHNKILFSVGGGTQKYLIGDIPYIFILARTPSEPLYIMCHIEKEIVLVNNIRDILPNEEITDYEKLLNNPEFSDFVIITADREFKVHKNIMSARSSVFSTMIAIDMKERKENCVTIKEFNSDVIQELLRYIYCGKVNNINKIAHDLFSAANKYQLEQLKYKCLEVLCKSVTIENAIELHNLVNLHNFEDLKKNTVDFIAKNIKSIISTSAFECLTDAELLKVLLRKILNN